MRSASLAHIQAWLARLYDLPPAEDVARYICGPELVRDMVGPQQVLRDELLLVAEDAEGVHVALYLDRAALAALPAEGVFALDGDDAFRASCLATEGVSHFLYVAFRAHHRVPVTQLELELQAEVDKYVAGVLGEGTARAIRAREGLSDRSREVRQRLFDSPRFLDPPHSSAGRRYRLAHRLAASYAQRLERGFVDRLRLRELEAELRRFYRLRTKAKAQRAEG
ncbi:MAG: hypothetical protein ACFCGT_13825 [Sandaracinaceae bacterium]